MRSSNPAVVAAYEENSSCRKFAFKSGSLLMSNLGQLFCTASWNGISYLQPIFATFKGGYPLLLGLQGLTSATVMLPFYYGAYRLDGNTVEETTAQLKTDFPLTWLFDGSWQLLSDVTVSFYMGDAFQCWRQPTYDPGELKIGIGTFQMPALLNFLILEIKARCEGGATWNSTMGRAAQSVLMGLVYEWFFCADKWFGNYYSERGETAAEKVSDSFVSGSIVALGSLGLDIGLILFIGILSCLKSIMLACAAETEYEPLPQAVEMGQRRRMVQYNSVSDGDISYDDAINPRSLFGSRPPQPPLALALAPANNVRKER